MEAVVSRKIVKGTFKCSLIVGALFLTMLKREPISLTGKEEIFLIGSSNAIGLLKMASATGKVVDLAIRGLSAVPKATSSYLNIVPNHSSEARVIIVVGSNGHEVDNYEKFAKNYVKSLCELFQKGYKNHQVLAVLPMVRGEDHSLYEPQLKRMRELKIQLKFLGVASVCWDDILPEGFDREAKTFGKKDLKAKRFVHYSEDAKLALARFVEALVALGFDKTIKEILTNKESLDQNN